MKITLYMAQSLDGFIATTDDETPWGEVWWDSWYAFTKTQDAIVMGRNTLSIMQDDGTINEIDRAQIIVLSSGPVSDFRSIHHPQEITELLAEDAAVMVAGGRSTNQSFFETRLIDEVIVDIEPHVFAIGIPLGWTGKEKLQLLDSKRLGGDTVQHQYSVTYS